MYKISVLFSPVGGAGGPTTATAAAVAAMTLIDRAELDCVLGIDFEAQAQVGIGMNQCLLKDHRFLR